MGWLKNRNKAIEIAKKQGVKNADSRNNGSTFATAMRTISNAMLNIEIPIKVVPDLNMKIQKEKCFLYTMDIVNRLGLEGFYFNKQENTVVYSLDEDFINKKNWKGV